TRSRTRVARPRDLGPTRSNRARRTPVRAGSRGRDRRHEQVTSAGKKLPHCVRDDAGEAWRAAVTPRAPGSRPGGYLLQAVPVRRRAPLHSPRTSGGRMATDDTASRREQRDRHSQFDLLRQRRFLPYFTVQALGAFNDNVYRQAIIGLVGGAISAESRALYTQLAPAIFIVPYFLFSATVGQIAERLEKQRLIVITTTMEIAIMSLAAVGFLLQNMPLLLVALFGTGLQSTLFGPVKYSILPSVLKPEELTGGNGLVEMGTSISILLGMIFGGSIFLLAGTAGPYVAAVSI